MWSSTKGAIQARDYVCRSRTKNNNNNKIANIIHFHENLISLHEPEAALAGRDMQISPKIRAALLNNPNNNNPKCTLARKFIFPSKLSLHASKARRVALFNFPRRRFELKSFMMRAKVASLLCQFSYSLNCAFSSHMLFTYDVIYVTFAVSSITKIIFANDLSHQYHFAA